MKDKANYHIDSQCSTNVYLGDGICDDQFNHRQCRFDDGDCCLKTLLSRSRCQNCICWSDQDFVDVTTDPEEEEVIVPSDGEMCLKLNQTTAYSCFPKAVVYYGGSSGRYLVKSMLHMY